MKEIIYNYDNVDENEINRIVRRAKALIINDNNEVVLALSHNNYYFIGGHVDNDESDFECLSREIKEETGVDIDIKPMKPFLRIKYFNKDYPSDGVNTMSLANYYLLKTNLKENKEERALTDSEEDGDFHIVNLPLYESVKVLTDSIPNSTRQGAVLDTIEAIKEYINISN